MTAALPTMTEFRTEFLSRLGSSALDDLSRVVRRRSDHADEPVADENGAWTNVLINLVLGLGAGRGFIVYPRRLYFGRGRGKGFGFNSKHDRRRAADDRGEHLVDGCWTTYRSTDDGWLSLLERGSPASPRIVLACECKWTSTVRGPVSPTCRLASILTDFAKLTDITAARKVMMFAFDEQLPFEEVATHCARQADPLGPNEDYLLLAWPLTARWSARITALRARQLPAGRETRG